MKFLKIMLLIAAAIGIGSCGGGNPNPPPPIPLSISTQTLAQGQLKKPYSQQLAAAGGVVPYTWSVSSGTLPKGITLSPAGLISGTPIVSGSFSFVIQVQDSSHVAQSAVAKLNLGD